MVIIKIGTSINRSHSNLNSIRHVKKILNLKCRYGLKLIRIYVKYPQRPDKTRMTYCKLILLALISSFDLTSLRLPANRAVAANRKQWSYFKHRGSNINADFHSVQFCDRFLLKSVLSCSTNSLDMADCTNFKRKRSQNSALSLNCTEWKTALTMLYPSNSSISKYAHCKFKK